MENHYFVKALLLIETVTMGFQGYKKITKLNLKILRIILNTF